MRILYICMHHYAQKTWTVESSACRVTCFGSIFELLYSYLKICMSQKTKKFPLRKTFRRIAKPSVHHDVESPVFKGNESIECDWHWLLKPQTNQFVKSDNLPDPTLYLSLKHSLPLHWALDCNLRSAASLTTLDACWCCSCFGSAADTISVETHFIVKPKSQRY